MPDDGQADPLILTARFDDRSASRFQRLRDLHFPPHLNRVPAHLTLFHALPGRELPAITQELAAVCGAEPVMGFRVAKPRGLGRGVAYELETDRLAALRARLSRTWTAWLSQQDRQGLRPHVTVQNKVSPDQARALLGSLEAGFEAWTGTIVGLELWHYRGGPWEGAARFPFSRLDDDGES